MITGRVYDSKTNEGIWNANIFLSDASGKITAQAIGTTSWFDGSYSLDTKGVSSGYITCSIQGYARRTFPLNSFTGQQHFAMTQTAVDLPPVEIIDTPITWIDKNKYLLLGGITFLSALAAWYHNRHNKNRK